MTRTINCTDPNLVLLNGNTAVYFCLNDGTFEINDTLIAQKDRSETRYSVVALVASPLLKKNTVMLNLTKEEI